MDFDTYAVFEWPTESLLTETLALAQPIAGKEYML